MKMILVDRYWMEEVVRRLEHERPGPESRLLRLRLNEAQGGLDYDDAVAAYLGIAAEAGDLRFTWDGVKDRSRINLIYDPFANLTIARRAQLEAARLHQAAGRDPEAEHLRAALAGKPRRRRSALPAGRRQEIAAPTP